MGSEFAPEIVARIMIAKSEKFIDTQKVSINAPVSVCNTFSCNHVCVYFKDKARGPEVSKRNAFSVLMASYQ